MRSLPNIASVSPTIQQGVEHLNSWLWAFLNEIKLVGGAFSLLGHEFQVEPMSVRTVAKVVRKARQMGWSELEILDSIHGLKTLRYPVGVGYLMPSLEKIASFSKTRFKPLIKRNPETIGRYVQDTDSVSLKQIGNGFLYFRSGRLSQEIQGQMKSSAGLKGEPWDHAVLDELDEMMPIDQVESYVDTAMAHSKIRTIVKIANPTLPDYGISAAFDESDQRFWFCKCRACGEWTCMDDEDLTHEEIFEKRIVEVHGKVIRACRKCGRSVDPRNGQWVPRRRDVIGVAGYSIGHPSASWIDPAALLKAFRQTRDLANFIRLILGRPYVEAENRLSIAQVLECCGFDGIQDHDHGPCYMGVDQGGSGKDLLHIVVGKKHPVQAATYPYLGIQKGWEELDHLMRAFHVTRCVVDGLPNQDDARKFAKRFPGRVFLSYFSDTQKGSYLWDEKKLIVNSNRTEAMDASHKELQGALVILPRQDLEIVQEFAKHCNAVAKKLEEDEETGSKRYVYVRLKKADHFRLANCYEAMARHGAPNQLLPGA